MSRTMDLLLQAGQQKYTLALNKQPTDKFTTTQSSISVLDRPFNHKPIHNEPAKEEPVNTVTTTTAKTKGRLQINSWVISAFILGFLMLINFGLIFRLSMLMKARDSEIITSLKGLKQVENSLDSLNQQMRIVSNDLNKIKQDNNTKIADLEKQIDVQAFMAKNLESAKNTLFHRVNNLESELSKVNEQIKSTGSEIR